MKRNFLLFLCLALIPAMAFIAAEHPFIVKLQQNLGLFNSHNPEEKIYLTTDKPFYKPGETIWVSAFALNGKDNMPSDISEIAHIEFIDTKGKIANTLLVKLEGGVGKCEFALDNEVVGGLYKIRAYTKYMRLFNPNNCFEKTLQVQSVLVPRILMKLDFDRKAYSSNDTVVARLSVKSIENQPLAFQDYSYTVTLNGEKLYTKNEQLNDSGCAKVQFILPKKLKTNDGLLNITTRHNGNTESISRSIPIVLNNIDLQFFPEGGYCVENVKTRVAFKALDEFGKPADIEGSVLDENNKVIYKFKTFHDGMGAFEFTPSNGKEYKAIITKPEKIEAVYHLPEIISEGFVLNVYNEVDKLKVRINSPDRETVHLVAQTKGEIQFTKTFKTQKGENTVEIPTIDFPSGVTQITMFNKNEEPVCTRLAFVNKQKLMNISISTDKPKYAPREKVIMKIRTTDENNQPVKANLALSVVDDKVFTFADDKQDNILSYLLLSSDVKGKIEEPGFYFKPDEPKANEALDYLLMTQGWRRFAWITLLKKDINKMQDYTEFSEKLIIRGHVIKRDTKEPVEGFMVWLNDGDTIFTNENGAFSFKNNCAHKWQFINVLTDMNLTTNLYLDGYSANSTYLNHRLNGLVYDSETGETLSDVKIILSADKKTTRTDFDGFYTLNEISNKQDYIIFNKEGYKTKKIPVDGPIVNCSLDKADKNIKIVKNEKTETENADNQAIIKEKSKVEVDLNLEDKIVAEQVELPVVSDLAESASMPMIVESERSDAVEEVFECMLIQEKPMFPGGDQSLLKYIYENVKYPQAAIEACIEGTVYIRFMVDKDGSIKNPKVMRSVDPMLEEEAINVVRNMPRFNPGKNNGVPVSTWFIIPVKFKLVHNSDSNSIKYQDNDYQICSKSESVINLHEARTFNGCFYSDNDDIRDDFRSTIYWNPSIKTDENGEAEISFINNEDETTFVTIAEGISSNGLIGRSEYRYHTQMNFSLEAKIPVYLSFYDKVLIPVNIVNNTSEEIIGNLTVSLPECFESLNSIPNQVKIKPNSFKNIFLEYSIGNVEGKFTIQISFESGKANDFIKKEIHIAPYGFPQNVCISGNQKEKTAKLSIPDYVKGSLKIDFRAYTSIFTDLMEGISGMIQQPYGCFEQTSSSTYPNILALKLMKETGSENYEIMQTANRYIDMGYKRLIGFETKEKGYEWFGNYPAHEGLTAYGLMEFTDMKSVYTKVDNKMVERTAAMLMERKDGKGGFKTIKAAYHSWGDQTAIQNAYIVYALSESGNLNARAELDVAVKEAIKSKDAYRLALIANTLFNYNEKKKAEEILNILITAIKKEGFSNLKSETSITCSMGNSLLIETSSLIMLAIMKSESPDFGILNDGMQFLFSKREYGMFGSTQSTVLALKAMCSYFSLQSKGAKDDNGKLSIHKNNKQIVNFSYNSKMNKILTVKNLETEFNQGTYSIKIAQTGDNPIPYSFTASWYTMIPGSDDECMVNISTKYETSAPKVGETVRLNVKLTNKTEKGLPNPIAKIGIPSGLSLQPWQLKEMQERKLFSYYEIDKNYLIVYYTSFNPKETKEIKLDLKAEVPGSYSCPASCAYLYYTDEFKSWCGGGKIEVEK